MNNKCVNLRYRRKKGQVYLYCTTKGVLEGRKCENNCLDREYKKTPKNTLKTINKKPLKKVSKKREFVSKKTYQEVYDRCNGMCVICGKNQDLHLHHVLGRGKDKTDNPNTCVMLCAYCHLEVVHKNNKYWRKKLSDMLNL